MQYRLFVGTFGTTPVVRYFAIAIVAILTFNTLIATSPFEFRQEFIAGFFVWIFGIAVWSASVPWSIVSLDLHDRKSGGRIFLMNAILGIYMAAVSGINVVSPAIFCVLTYFMGGLRKDDLSTNFGFYVATMILLQHCFVVWYK